MNRAKAVIVDDHPAVRRGIVDVLAAEDDLEICGEADNAEDAARVIRETKPDVVILDISLKSGSIFDLIQTLKARSSAPKVVVYSMHEESLYGVRVLNVGADGYVNKEQPPETLSDAIRAVVAGRTFYSDATLAQAGGAAAPTSKRPTGMASLTNRELEVFGLLGSGMSTKNVAESLNISLKTVESHRESIKAKLNIENFTRFMRHAVEWHLHKSEPPVESE